MKDLDKKAPEQWSDLKSRFVSSVVLVCVGTTAIWVGGFWFHVIVALICSGMMWEFSRLTDPDKRHYPAEMGVLAGLVMTATAVLPDQLIIPVLLTVSVVGMTQLKAGRLVFGLYSAALIFACYGLINIRSEYGAVWIAWIVSVVVASDVAGYFVGRFLGGPKFWPKISPKKTWSGTVGGWVAAGCVGMIFGGLPLVILSISTSFASQLGDATESALKRRAGIKDSSNLIPGHGGLLDRFDSMLGASLFVSLMGVTVGLPVI
ncbi:phosphatidate cytidylyltransferase [Pseudopelagicola sp. nBUS_19]|uniref:phosphatidate cytidylyltransferase n=1 Tax=Pseudopelagicola sp. nBUS_19 TaxID=3395316 RepID=UPI003EBE8F9D